MRRGTGSVGFVSLLLFASSALVGWAAWMMYKAGIHILPAFLPQKIYEYGSIGVWAQAISLQLNTLNAFAAQALLLLIFAVGVFFHQRWAWWGTIAYLVFIIGFRFVVWGMIVHKVGIERTGSPVTFGTLLGILSVTLLLRPKVRALFQRTAAPV